jgi:hypothetical protein
MDNQGDNKPDKRAQDMTPKEYQQTRRDYEGKNACGGCGLMLIIFGVLPVSLVFAGLVPGLFITFAAFCLFVWGMMKWQG